MSIDLSVLVRRADPVQDATHLPEAEFAAVLTAIEATVAGQPVPGHAAVFLHWVRRRPAVVFAVALAITAFVVALPLLLLSGGDGGVAEPTVVTTEALTTTAAPTTTTVAPSTTAAPTTAVPAVVVPPAPEIIWTKVPHQAAFDDALIGEWVASFTRGGPGLVGIGYVYEEGDRRPHGVVFVSSDGEVWERIDPPFVDDTGTYAEEGPADIAVGPDGRIVVVGGDGEDAAVWVSDDGYEWTRVSVAALSAPEHQMMLAVAAGGPGFVAVGDGGGDYAGVWVSPDGLEWSAVEDDGLLPGDGDLWIDDIAAGGPGLIAVGRPGLVSASGYDWEPLPEETFAAEAPDCWLSVAAQPETGRLTAFGCAGLWTSDDGYEWTLTDRELPLGGPTLHADVAWDGDVGVAAGFNRWHSLWVTGDAGSTWTRVEPVEPVFSDFFDQAVTVTWFEGRWIVVGQSIDGGAVWIGTPAG